MDEMAAGRSMGDVILQYECSSELAVICGDTKLTYKELCRRGRAIARSLVRLGIRKGDRVAMNLSRSADAISMMLGIALSGGVMAALHNGWAEEQLSYVLTDCSPVVVADDAMAKKLQEEQDEPAGTTLPKVGSEDLFTILYTSGSTGQPKGVAICHGMMVNACQAHESNLLNSFIKANCHRLLVDFNFSYMAFAMFSSLALCNGKCIVLATEEECHSQSLLGGRIIRSQVDALFRPPTLMTGALADPVFASSLSGIRSLSLIGEKVTDQAVQQILPFVPNARFFTHYGSSEMLGLTDNEYRPGEQDLLGKTLSNVFFVILAENGREVRQGESGELCVGGLSARLGSYWNDPQMNSLRYEEHPRYGRIFHTRDQVRQEENGRIRFVGRLDQMIKLHGQRIEPGMIEQAMLAFPGIREAAVVLHQEQNTQALSAFYTVDASFDGSNSAARERALFQTLSRKLPYYMIPSSLTMLERMPLNTSGKLDRKALSKLPLKSEGFAASETALEELLCTLYRQVLGTQEKVGAQTSFFALGGDSLSAMRLMDALRRYGWRMELRWIFACPSPRMLAACLEREDEQSSANAGERLHLHPDAPGNTSPSSRMPSWTVAQTNAVRQMDSGKEIEALYPLSAPAAERAATGDPWMFSGFWVFDLTGDLRTLQERFARMTRAHCALRSVFLFPEGEPPVQAVLREHTPDFFLADRAFEAEEGVLLSEKQKRYLGRLLRFETAQKKNLEKQVLIRGGVIRIAPGKALLHLYYSHLLLDNHSVSTLLEELLDTTPFQTDTPRMERWLHRLLSLDRETAMAYWQSEGFGEHSMTLFPAPAENGEEHTPLKSFMLGSKKLTLEIRAFCRREQVTMAALLHCTLGRALCSITGRGTVSFWSMTDGRAEDELSLPGMFSHRFPFLYHRGETVRDCQERLLRSKEHAWIFRQMELRANPDCGEREISLDMVQTFQSSGRMQEIQTSDAVDRETLTRLSVERYHAEEAEFQGMLMIFSFPATDRIFMYRAPAQQFDQNALKELNQALRSELNRLLDADGKAQGAAI